MAYQKKDNPKLYDWRKKGWPPGCASITRPTLYGNPFRIREHGTREEVVHMHKEWLEAKMKEDPEMIDRIIRDLGGRDLVCFCEEWDGQGEPPGKCHGELLLLLANPGLNKEAK